MKRLIYTLGLCVALIFGSQQRASAQFATFDASNLAQAILAFLQDGDNMVLNTEQFLQNLGVAKEQGGPKRPLEGPVCHPDGAELRADGPDVHALCGARQGYERQADYLLPGPFNGE